MYYIKNYNMERKIMMNKKKKIFAIIMMIAIVMVFGVGCGNDAKDGDDAKTLVLGSLTDFKKGSGEEGQSLIFETLMTPAKDMSIKPGLIESWDINGDQSEYTLHIRKGVKFSDGTPLTADIVKYSLKAWGPYRDGGYIYAVKSYKMKDDNTLVVKFNGSYGNFLIEMSRIFCSLKDSLDDKGNVKEYKGTGPFVLDKYEQDQSAELKVNKDYWNKDKKPSVETVKWKVIPDENSRIQAVQSGEVDAVGVTEHYCSLPYSTVSDIKEKGDLNVDVHAGAGLIETYMYNYTKGLMKDINLRKAVTKCIDREKMADKIAYGLAQASGYFMSPDYKYNARNEKPYKYDPDGAKKILADAGYKDTDKDGIMEKNGKPVKLKVVVGSDESSRSTAVYAQQCLKKIGIDSTLEALDSSARDKKAASGDFDIAYTHPWLKTPQTYMTWRCNNSDYDDFGTCFGVNKKFPGYIKAMNKATSEKKLDQIFDNVWADIYSFYPGTPLYSTPKVFIYSDKVSGFKCDPDETLIDLSEVEIKK